MVRFVAGGFALSAVFCAMGCASSLSQESATRSSLRFAVVEPAGRCASGGSARTIATDVRERDLEAAGGDEGFAVRFTQKKSAKTHTIGVGALVSTVSATIDEEWVTVDGARLWRSLQPIQWIRAVRDGENVAVVMISNGKLLAGVAGHGILRGPIQTLGTASFVDSPPDIVIQSGKVAVTWEGAQGSFIGAFNAEQGWSVHNLPTPGSTTQIMDPRIAPVSGGRFIVLWREGTLEHHGLRAQIYNADARPVGGSFDPAPGLEVVRADVAAKPDGEVLVASLVATGKGLDLVTSPMHCNLD